MNNVMDTEGFGQVAEQGQGLNDDGGQRSQDGIVDDREFVDFASQEYGISQEKAQEIFADFI